MAALRNSSLEEFLDSLDLPKEEVLSQGRTPSGLGIGVLTKVADALEITLDDLIDDRIDESWIRNPELAAGFQAEEGSRLRTSLAVLHWIEKNYGREPTKSLMRSLRIPEKTLSDPSRPVRLRMLCTLLRAVRARGLTDSSIFEMGLGAVNIRENNEIFSILSQQKTPQQVCECFFSEIIHKFESNYDYKIEKSGTNSITLRIEPREARILENGQAVAADRTLSVYRWGVTAGLLRAIGRSSASAKPIRLLDETSKDEMIRLEWNNPAQAAILISSRRRSNFSSPSAS